MHRGDDYQTFFFCSSQELIGEFYKSLLNHDTNKVTSFEEIFYSIIEDINVYKKDIRRLEQTLKKYTI